MTTSSASVPGDHGVDRRSIDELFATIAPIRSADDLAHDGVFDDDELDEFLADLASLRHGDGR
ncbi:MAG: hypothetical protein BGO26_10735 [Actinobacteria bacterium 69-20]|nr:hypothetical protein [Actinomycetota bacterium]OJV25347.1 MAG: hypothetical protein BGO26_10735 [Actinobacteria bacterium 69-20]